MTLPTIHLNGTASSELLETACDALGVMRAAIEAVNATSPNGRDYYPQGDSAYTNAAREHAGRIAKLWSVLAELEQLAEHIADEADTLAARAAQYAARVHLSESAEGVEPSGDGGGWRGRGSLLPGGS